jgi:hypothetical protein
VDRVAAGWRPGGERARREVKRLAGANYRGSPVGEERNKTAKWNFLNSGVDKTRRRSLAMPYELEDRFMRPVLSFVFGFLRFSGFFKLHVTKFVGVKDLATLQALDKLGVFVPGNDSNFRVFADGGHRFGSGE